MGVRCAQLITVSAYDEVLCFSLSLSLVAATFFALSLFFCCPSFHACLTRTRHTHHTRTPNVDTYIALRSLIVRFCVACGWLVSLQRVSYLSGVGGCRQICKFWLCDGPHKNLMGREQEALCAETWAKTPGKYVGRFDQPPKLSTTEYVCRVGSWLFSTMRQAAAV